MCACSRVGEGCGRAVVGEGAFQICGVWFSLCVCRVGEGCGRAVVGEGAFQICGVWFSLCVCRVGEGCAGTVVGIGGVLSTCKRRVFVGKPACSHVSRLGVVWIECLVLEHCFLRLSSLFSP